MLENLTSGSVKAAMRDAGAKSADLWMVPIGDIREAEGFNVRTNNAERLERIAEIGESILANGFLRDKPLSGYIAREDGKDIIYVVDGYTRLAGAYWAIERGAEIEVLPVITKPAGTNIEDLTIGLVVSNSGTPLTPIEKAAVCKRLVGYGMTEAVIAKRLSFTRQYVADLLTLIAAPQAVRTMVEAGEVSAANAVATVKAHGEKASGELADKLVVAKAAGKTKVTAASLKTKVSVVDLGVGWIANQLHQAHAREPLVALLSHVSGVEVAVIEKKLANAKETAK